MIRIIAAVAIAQLTPLNAFNQDIRMSTRCTDVGYTKVYEDVTRMMLDGTITGRDRYYLVMAMRHEMCGKETYAKYEEGLSKLETLGER